MKRNTLSQFIVWYFLKVPKNIFFAFKNFLQFNLEFFSVPLLLKTFFTPWKRYKEEYSLSFDLNNRINVFVANLINRILGAFVRSILIITGTILEVVIFVLGVGIMALWFCLPVLMWLGLAQGFKYLFLYYYA